MSNLSYLFIVSPSERGNCTLTSFLFNHRTTRFHSLVRVLTEGSITQRLYFVYLFIYLWLFYNAVSSSVCIVSNNRMNNELKRHERKQL
jgi:hypothetical protein